MPGTPEPDAKEQEKLGFLERHILGSIESALASQGITKDVLQGWSIAGKRALSDVRTLVYGGTLADGTQVRGYAHLEARLLDRIEQLEAALQGTQNPTLPQEGWSSRDTSEAALEDQDDHVDDEAGASPHTDTEE